MNNWYWFASKGAGGGADGSRRADLGAVIDELLELGRDLHKRTAGVRLVVGNALLAIIHINFKGRSIGTQGRSFANCLSFQKTIVAPRVTCRRNRSLSLSCTDHRCRGLNGCLRIRMSDDLGLNEYFIREAIICRVHVEIRPDHVPLQIRIVSW